MDDSLPQTFSQGNAAYTRYCPKCKIWLPFKNFHRDRSNGDGLCCYCIKCKIEYREKRRERDPNFSRNECLRRKYNITHQQYNRMLAEQDGVCYICKKPETVRNGRARARGIRPLAVDHDHKTGQARRLLCQSCNRKVWIAEIDAEELIPAREYLEEMKAKNTSLNPFQLKLTI